MGFDASKLIEGLKAARDAKLRAATRAVDLFGEHVIGDAQQLTPVKTGFLQASGTTEPAVASGDVITKAMGFNAEYSAAVHEKLESKHAVGQAKYLETAMRENGPKFAPFAAGEVAKVEG